MSHVAEAITPAVGDLIIECTVQCPVSGCGEVLQSSAHLQMHIVRHHNGRQLDSVRTLREFYCPVEGCKRGKGGKPFPRLGQLKQHYQTIHTDKNFSCQKCGKEFGLKDVCMRHESECGEEFTCASCAVVFRTKNALYKHAKTKKHTLPGGSAPRRKQKREPTPVTPIIVLPQPVIKQVVKLAKQVSTSTQTTETFDQCDNKVEDRTSQTSHPYYSSTPSVRHSLESSAIKRDCSLPQTSTFTSGMGIPYQLSDSAASSGQFYPLVASLSATQTELTLTDLSTQTDLTYLATELLNFGTQTINAMATQGCQTQPLSHHGQEFGTQTQQSDDWVLQYTPTSVPVGCECEFGTQTGGLEYGTQTCGLEFGTQTGGLEFGTQTGGLEFGTQTSGLEFGTQTGGLEFAIQEFDTQTSGLDFGTQTVAFSPEGSDLNFVEQALSSTVLPPDCMDLGTQTLDAIPSLDFGVQTLLLNETKDQGSQT